jgi:ribosomal-protein-alanine N-acetyltransferase
VEAREGAEAAWKLEPLAFTALPQIGAIEAAVFPEPLTLTDLLRLWLQPETLYVGYCDRGRVAAYFGFQVHGPTAHVIANATHPEYRRRGLATRLLREAEPLARARGARWFLGEVRRSNAAQRDLLRKVGWREVGLVPSFFGNGEDAYVVWRCLGEAPGGSDP